MTTMSRELRALLVLREQLQEALDRGEEYRSRDSQISRLDFAARLPIAPIRVGYYGGMKSEPWAVYETATLPTRWSLMARGQLDLLGGS